MEDRRVCLECDSLWVLLAQATARYAKLQLDQHRADPAGPQDRDAQEREILRAAMLRQQIRERLEAHEENAHPQRRGSAAGLGVVG